MDCLISLIEFLGDLMSGPLTSHVIINGVLCLRKAGGLVWRLLLVKGFKSGFRFLSVVFTIWILFAAMEFGWGEGGVGLKDFFILQFITVVLALFTFGAGLQILALISSVQLLFSDGSLTIQSGEERIHYLRDNVRVSLKKAGSRTFVEVSSSTVGQIVMVRANLDAETIASQLREAHWEFIVIEVGDTVEDVSL